MDPGTHDGGGIKTPLMPTQEQQKIVPSCERNEQPIISHITTDHGTSITIQLGSTPPEDQIHDHSQSPPPANNIPPPPSLPNVVQQPPEGPIPKQRNGYMAMSVQSTLSKTSNLVNFLPTGTLLAFEMLLPSVSGNGKCNDVSTVLIGSILAFCATSCCFLHFTDSAREDQKIYYGFVTFKGLLVYKAGVGVRYIDNEPRLKAGITDFIHAAMSALVFVAIAFSDHRVTKCLFPRHVNDMDEIMQTFPLMVGIVCSGLFLIFPNTRYGIGSMPP